MNLKLCTPIYFASYDNILNKNSFDEKDKKTWPYQMYLLKKVRQLRDSLTNDSYEETLINFILMSESCTLYPYVCPEGRVTIGAGFALTNKNNLQFTDFGITVLSQINVDIKNLKQNLLKQIEEKQKIITEEDSKKILSFILKQFRGEIIHFMPFFEKLPLNIQISLQSLYYNRHTFIKGGMLLSLKNFIETKKDAFLEDVLFRICRNCNCGAPYINTKAKIFASYWKGIQYRRYREMIMSSNLNLDKKIFFGLEQEL
ncbi:hypothetical protein [Alphaproteobacteria bacterium endosymbiont of Tiliacea citrago]|uniref:hypothetical protein n=1 Tax=Alphaproteobacteria bacterium endosymbiont of Tiliacea citrago TaxID=3077944 RepID=UPI00313AC53F